MHKYFIAILLISLNINILSQVVIKDEIVLDEMDSEDSGLYMPFYGDVGEVIYYLGMACNNTRVTLIVNGQETLFDHCWNWDCSPPPLFCTCGAANVFETVDDVAKGSLIDTKFLKCLNVGGNYQWVELVHRYILTGSQDDLVTYEIEFELNGQWYGVGKMNFLSTTPLNCPNAENYCDNTSLIAPLVELIPVIDNGTYGINGEQICSENSDWTSWSTMAKDNDYEFSITPCFDRQFQKWRYNFTDGTIFFNWVIGYCPQNTPVGSEMLNDITNVPPNYPCESLRYDVERHLHYNPNPGPHYFFKSLLYFHEKAHMELLQEYIDFWYPTSGLYFLENLQRECNEFNPNDPNSLLSLINDILNAYSLALYRASVDYNILLTDYREYTEEELIHPLAIPHIQEVLNSINCP